MTNPVAVNAYAVGVGTAPNASMVPIVSTVTPASTNISGPNGPFKIGQMWVNTTALASYQLVGLTSSNGTVTATWNLLATDTGALNTLTGDSGGAISPSAGNITLAGTANQVTTTGSGSTITYTLSSTLIAPGSLEVTGLLKGDASATINTAGTTLNLATDNDTAAVNLGNGTSARTISIGTTSGVKTIAIGNGVSGNQISIGNGVNTSSQTINIADGASATAASIVNLLSGATPGASQTLTVMSGVASAGTQSVAILGGANTTGSQSFALFNGAIAGATDTVNLFSGTIASGTCTFNLFNGNASGGTLVANIFGSTAATTAGTVNIGTGAAAHVLNFGSSNAGNITSTIASGSTYAVVGSGGTINIGADAATNTVTIGTTTSTATTNIKAGSGKVNVTGAIANSSTITSAGSVNINGAGTFLGVHHGAATDFVGACTLSSGTVTVNNTNIATGDIILLTRVSINGSTTLGELTYTISNGTSFTVTSVILGTPGSTQTADTSVLNYMIVRPI